MCCERWSLVGGTPALYSWMSLASAWRLNTYFPAGVLLCHSSNWTEIMKQLGAKLDAHCPMQGLPTGLWQWPAVAWVYVSRFFLRRPRRTHGLMAPCFSVDPEGLFVLTLRLCCKRPTFLCGGFWILRGVGFPAKMRKWGWNSSTDS